MLRLVAESVKSAPVTACPLALSRGNAAGNVNYADNQPRGEARHGVTESRGMEASWNRGTVIPY